jgi:ADP-ribosyl-[dinitrogen reductase] hydrolase
MLAGAYYGLAGIPPRWLKRMDRKIITETDEAAVRLVAASPAGKVY